MPATAAEGPEGIRTGNRAVLETDRLILRAPAPEDGAAVQALAADWEVARWTDAIPHPYPPDGALAWIVACEEERQRGESFTYVVERRRDKALLGAVSLRFEDAGPSAEIGYWIGRPHWRQGYGGEAVRRLIAYAFEVLKLDAVEAVTMLDNVASAGLLKAAGLVETGRGEHPYRSGTTPVRTWRMRRDDTAVTGGPKPIVLVAAVALVDAEGRVLLAQRPPGKKLAGMWEFPGGKVDPGETPEAALIRELKEEIDIDVAASCLAPFTFASHGYAGFHLLMPLYVCRVWKGTVRAREGQQLAWVRPVRMGDYPMPPADKPLVAMLRDLL
jgi:8-oxo-dGTP diphosphatase